MESDNKLEAAEIYGQLLAMALRSKFEFNNAICVIAVAITYMILSADLGEGETPQTIMEKTTKAVLGMVDTIKKESDNER